MDISKGSYTLEAAFIFPILFFSIIATMHIGLNLYQNAKIECQQYEGEKQWMVKEFYMREWADKVVDGVNGDE